MKLYSTLFFLVILASSAFSQERYVKNELLIKVEAGKGDSVAARFNLAGASVVETLGDLGWQRISLAAGKTVEGSLKEFANVPGVVAAQPNFYYRLLNTPNDPSFGSLYGMIKISAPAAWDIATGSSAVVVADIDTGMRFTHEDLAPNAWTNSAEIEGNGIDDDANGYIDDYRGYDFRFNDPDPSDEFGGGHGTHTAGTIGAVGNNGLGVVGVNWTLKLMPIKIYSSAGTDTTSAMLINAYNYVRMMKNRGVNIRVTNNSYSGCNEACGYD